MKRFNFRQFFRIDFKELFNFGKGRAVVFTYSTILPILFVDLIGFKYWQFAIGFTPFSFIMNYWISRHTLQRGGNKG